MLTGPALAESNCAMPHDIEPAHQAFYDKIATHDMAPLWLELMGHGDKEPVSQCVPHLWRFGTAKQLMLEAGELISAEDATRRVLVLENPAMHGKSQTTNTLFAGIQMILPGEIAPPHRHVACALRFVLDGKGAYTNVGGEKAVMNRGDLIVTPSWTAHEHGNQSDQPMLWLDVLDLPTVRFFEAGFFERVGSGRRTNDQARSNASARPHPSPLQDSQKPLKYSPVVNYRYAEMRPRLEQLIAAGDIDRRHGAQLRYANPRNGGWVTPTMATQLALLPRGFVGAAHRSTDGLVFVCVEGRGTTRVEERTLEWSAGDVFVVPSWTHRAHDAIEESVLFAISDRAAQEALGIWCED
jgi:gentisate 1,2-dioxygenase